MKQIINGKLYDTEKSRLLCKEYCPFGPVSELYISAKGTLFFMKHNLMSNECFLAPVKKEEVTELLAKKNPDAYIEFFGEVEEA